MTSGKFVTTIGYERRHNPSLQFDDLERFVDHMNKDLPPRPANMSNIVAINQGRRPLTMEWPTAAALTSETTANLVRSGYLALDTRPYSEYAKGHVAGAYNIQVDSGQFEQSVGWIMPPDEPFVVVVDSPSAAQWVVHKLAFVGLDGRVVGYLPMAEWQAEGRPLARVSQIEVQALHRQLRLNGMGVLDVRSRDEFGCAYIESAHNADFKLLPQVIDGLPFDVEQPVAVICASGSRSITACGVLLRKGYQHVCNVIGGMTAWQEAGLPTHGVTDSPGA